VRLRIAHGPAGARPLSFYRRGAFRQLGHPPVVIVAARDRPARGIGDGVRPPALRPARDRPEGIVRRTADHCCVLFASLVTRPSSS
jgi:hypothetical protein